MELMARIKVPISTLRSTGAVLNFDRDISDRMHRA